MKNERLSRICEDALFLPGSWQGLAGALAVMGDGRGGSHRSGVGDSACPAELLFALANVYFIER